MITHGTTVARAAELLNAVKPVIDGAPSRFRGMSYEGGINAALRWVFGLIDPENGEYPHPYPPDNPELRAELESILADAPED